MEHFLEDADDIHYFQFPAFGRTYRAGCHQCGHQFDQVAVRTVPCQCDGSSLPVSMYRLSLESGGHAAMTEHLLQHFRFRIQQRQCLADEHVIKNVAAACRMKVSSIFV